MDLRDERLGVGQVLLVGLSEHLVDARRVLVDLPACVKPDVRQRVA